MKQLGPLSPAC